jgi:hypothetical protein
MLYDWFSGNWYQGLGNGKRVRTHALTNTGHWDYYFHNIIYRLEWDLFFSGAKLLIILTIVVNFANMWRCMSMLELIYLLQEFKVKNDYSQLFNRQL